MQRGISYQGFLPIREQPHPMAGMQSQVLFGERFSIIKSEGPYLLIKTDSDHFEGWVERIGVQVVKEAKWEAEEPEKSEKMAILPSVKVNDLSFSHQLLLPAGSVLQDSDLVSHRPGKNRFVKVSEEGWISTGQNMDPEKIGKGLISIPGMQGGRCGFGFDAPGLVQFLRRCMGKFVPHDIMGQSTQGSIINFIHEAQKGDLAFFNNGEDIFTHVGMVLEEGKIIHASDQVRIDRLDQQGIYCEEKEGYTHQLRIIKST